MPFGIDLASFPGPSQLFVVISTEKRERACIFPHVSGIRIESLIVRGYTGPRTAKRANVAGNLSQVSS